MGQLIELIKSPYIEVKLDAISELANDLEGKNEVKKLIISKYPKLINILINNVGDNDKDIIRCAVSCLKSLSSFNDNNLKKNLIENGVINKLFQLLAPNSKLFLVVNNDGYKKIYILEILRLATRCLMNLSTDYINVIKSCGGIPILQNILNNYNFDIKI